MISEKTTVILPPRMSGDSVRIWKACLDLGWHPMRLPGWRVPDGFLPDGRLVIYGEPLFAEAVADQIGWELFEPPVDWLTAVPTEFLGREVRKMSLSSARQLDSAAFVKPADGKIFEARVYGSGAELPAEDHVDGDVLVLCSGIVDFRLEVRCFVAERSIISLSPYWRNGELAQGEGGGWRFLAGEEAEAIAFARAVLADGRMEIPPACTVDVGRLPGGEWAIIEANPIWGAGLYGCDAVAVLQALPLAFKPKREVAERERRWVNPRRRAGAE